MSWTIGLGVILGGVVLVVVVVLSWMSRERKGQQDHGNISPQWINEQRLNERESRDR
jgi:hypothetical protein